MNLLTISKSLDLHDQQEMFGNFNNYLNNNLTREVLFEKHIETKHGILTLSLKKFIKYYLKTDMNLVEFL